MMRHEDGLDELNAVKANSSLTEIERDHTINEAKEIKRQMNNAEASLKEALRNAKKELQVKDNVIDSLKSEIDKLMQKIEFKLSEKEASLQNVENEAKNFKSSLAQAESLLFDSKREVDRLAVEMGRVKESEANNIESFAPETSQIEQSSILLENSKVQITSLEEKMQCLLKESERKEKEAREEMERLKDEILVHKGNANRVKEMYNEVGSLDTKALLDEIDILKDELKEAMEAEETSKRAMDDLAMALKEVSMESNQAKENLSLSEQQLQEVKEEVASLKKLLKSQEEKYELLLKESKKENDRLKNIVNRLRLEVEESILGFNDRETEFIKCIKSIEEEKNSVQEECNTLVKSLREVEEASKKSKEENKKLRDILKQALNEASVAKEAASLAREENSYLKDSLIEKDKALLALAQETERVRINEAEANETIKELKREITLGSMKEFAKLERENKEHSKELKKELKQEFASVICKSSKDYDEDDGIGRSIHDLVDSSMKEYRHRSNESDCSSEFNLNIDQFEDIHLNDSEIDKASQRKRRALLTRFGDLLRRKSSQPSKDVVHSPKEGAHSLKEIPA